MNNKKKAIFSALFSNIFFGLSFIFTTIGLNITTPSILLAYRFGLAFITLLIIIIVKKIPLHYEKRDLWLLLIMGLCQPVLYFIFENNGILYSTTSFASIMIAMIPIVCMIFSYFILHEKVNYQQIIASMIAVGGVILMSIVSWSNGTIKLLGIILLIGAVLASVGFNLISRSKSSKYSVIERTFVMFLLSFMSFTTIALIENLNNPINLVLPLTNYRFYIAILYLGIFSSVFAFMLVNYANTYLPLAQSTIFACLSTVVSLIVGILILHEPFSWWTILSALLIIGGVYFVQKKKPSQI